LVCKLYSDGSSKTIPCTWYTALAKQDLYLSTIIQGYNQYQYVLVMDHDYTMMLYELDDNDDITRCKVELGSVQGKIVSNIQVLENNLVTYQKPEGIYGYSIEGKEKLQLKGDSAYCTDGRNIYAYNQIEREMDQYSASGELLHKYTLSSDPHLIKMIGCEDDKVYILTENGLCSINLTSLNYEVVLEQDLLLENGELMNNVTMVHEKEKNIDFYTYSNMNDNNQACYQYVYTPDKVKQAKKKVLTIYSEYEDDFIKKAITAFKRENTDVDIHYVVKDGHMNR